ncbi:metallophosphoesterase [Bdellovibrio sp. BCCA]|uniref:metallophosphoesterase n=1 Tax=Bdellovibrio sp. BCCA TaxID=3136281 RepID=UPI0030F183BF
MSRFFISDIHAFHELQLYEKYRNFPSLENMHEIIVYRWNKVVSKHDTTYIVGDFSFGKFEETKEFLSRLNGKKILIVGNHDRRSKRLLKYRDYIEMGFSDIMDEDVIKFSVNENGTTRKIPVHLKHYPYHWHPLREIYNKVAQLFGAFREDSKTYHQFYPKYTPMWHIHGHYHAGPLVHDNEINVSWDTLGGYPISESKIIALIREQEKRSKIIRYLERILGRSI